MDTNFRIKPIKRELNQSKRRAATLIYTTKKDVKREREKKWRGKTLRLRGKKLTFRCGRSEFCVN